MMNRIKNKRKAAGEIMVCGGTDMILSTRKTLRKPLKYMWPGLSFIRNLSCSGSWSFCYSETKEWKGLNKTSVWRVLTLVMVRETRTCQGKWCLLTYISRYVSTEKSWT